MLLKAILLGLIQGIFEFLPVSSSGHVMLVYTLLQVKTASPAAFLSAAHLGSLIAVLFYFKKDVLHVVSELLQLPGRLKKNMDTYIEQLKHGIREPYHPLFTNNYGKIAMLCTVGNLPTAVLGIYLRHVVDETADNVLVVGMGFLITAILLLVASVMPVGRKTPQDLTLWQMLLVGVCQGLAVFPGVSRFAVVMCMLMILGQTKKGSVICAMLMQIPVLFGAFIYTVSGLFAGESGLAVVGAACLCAVLSAFLGCLLIRMMLTYVHKHKMLIFAVYCVVLAVVCTGCHLYFAK